jgi:uncharacterized glyoxalase superfamily protein PhnB
MPERDLIEQLDQAVEAMLRGAAPVPASPEITALLKFAEHVGNRPDPSFRSNLKASLIAKSRPEKKTMATTTANWIPPHFHTLTPYLHPASAAALIDFLKRTFDADEMGRFPDPAGRIMHAAVRIGDSIVEMGEPPVPAPTSLRAYVPDVDATYRRARDAGATSLYEPVDQSYGDREAGVMDPQGNYWFIARPIKAGDYKHPGLQDVALYMFVRNTPAFLEFVQNAFGAEVLGRHEDSSGRVLHADIKIGDSIMGLGEAHDRWQPMPAGIHFYVPNVDQVYQRALAAGGVSERPPTDQPYGERSATILDSQGNRWYLATRL